MRQAAETDFEAIESLAPEFYKNMKMSLINGQGLNPTPSIGTTELLSTSYLMFAGEHAVGGVIIAAEDKIDALRANFEIEDFVNLDLIERRENHKVLYCFVAPGFHSLGKFMLSEAIGFQKRYVCTSLLLGAITQRKSFEKFSLIISNRL